MKIGATLDLVGIITLVVGGLGLFLFGIYYLSTNLRTLAAGDAFRKSIGKATKDRMRSAAIGTGFTAIIQSAGGTSALSIGLVKANALSLSAAVAIIIGANIGQCMTAFLISIPSIGQFMPFVVFLAAFILMIVKNPKVQMWGKLVFAFGLIFMGIWLMEDNLKKFADEPGFISFLEFLNSQPWLGLLFGTAITLILQSSGAVIGVLQGIYAAMFIEGVAIGNVSLYGILPILIGAEIGACIPSVLSAIGGTPTAKRVAFCNVLMKVSTAIIFMAVICGCNTYFASTQSSWNPKLQLALSHLVFNLSSAIIFLPLLTPMCKVSELIFKENKKVGKAPTFHELDPQVIKETPSIGIALAKDLSDKMFGYVYMMFKKLDVYYKKGYNEDLKTYILELERATDNIDRHLADFLLNTETGRLSRRDVRRHGRVMRGIKDIERIGDYGENLLTFYTNIYEKKNKFDEIQLKEINQAHKMALDLIGKTLKVYTESDKALALRVIKQRRDYNKKLDDYQEAYFKRESSKKGESNYISLIYVDILNSYERVYSHCANVAKLFNSDKDIDRYSDSQNDKTKFTNMSMRY